MFLVGLLIAFWTFADSWSNKQKEKLVVKVFFCTQPRAAEDATSQQINAVRAKLDGDSRVKSYEFITKARALEMMREKQPEMVRGPGLESPAGLLHRHPGQGRVHEGDRTGVQPSAGGGREGDVRGEDGQPHPQGGARDQGKLPPRGHHPDHRLGDADREHDPPVDLRAAA